MPLRDFLLSPNMDANYNNVLTAFLMVLVYRGATEIAIWLRVRFELASQLSRQVLHMSLASSIIFWPLFVVDDNPVERDNWSWRLNVILPLAVLVRLLFKAKLNDPDDTDVQNLSRSSSPSELLFGPMQLCCLMIWLGLYYFMTQEAAILAAAIGIGDGLAPMIGSLYGRHFYHMPLSHKKTMEGSVVGVFLGTVAACYLFLGTMGLEIPPLRCVLVYGILAAVVEGSAPGNFDNVVTALVMHLSMDRIQEWLTPEGG